MKTSFVNGEAKTDAVAEADMFGDGAEGESKALTLSAMPALGEVTGEIRRNDIAMPRLNIVQAVGPISKTAGLKFGDIVLNKEIVIAHKDETVQLVVLSVRKYFQERFPKYIADGPRPQIFDTEREVLDAGLTLDWKKAAVKGEDDKPPTAEPIADIDMIIKKPANVNSPIFCITLDGDAWTPARWTVQRTAYSRAAKAVFTERATSLAECGLLFGTWTLSAIETRVKGNEIAAPKMCLVGRNSETLVGEIKSLMGS